MWMMDNKLLVKIYFYVINVERALGDGAYYGMLGRAFWDYARLVMGCLKEETKVGKGKD